MRRKPRAVRLNGHATSLRLEAAFWDTPQELVCDQGMSVARFISTLHDEVLAHRGEVSNRASLSRVTCLHWLRHHDMQMVQRLDAGAQDRFGTAYRMVAWENDRVGLLRDIEHLAFFGKIRGDLVVSLYPQEELWPKFGYESSSAEHGSGDPSGGRDRGSDVATRRLS